MSTIKSSTEHLTLNADGSGKDIKFQANGVEKASISSAGAFTSTSIDATKLSGTVPNFTSTGIDDNATSTAITIDASENVGIGVTPESDWGSRNVLQFGLGASISGRTGSVDLEVSRNAKYTGNNPTSTGKYINADQACMYRQNGEHSFHVAPSGTADSAISWTTAMTIDNNGKTLMNTVSSSDNTDAFKITNNSTASWALNLNNAGQSNYILITAQSGTGLVTHHQFNNSNGVVGTIKTSGTSTSYNTSSDYRLKENVLPMTGSIDRLKALKPSKFNFKADPDKTVDGFLAHEAQEVVPEAVGDTPKDAMMDEEYEVTPAVMDGDTVVTEAVMGTRSVPDYQGIDQSKLVPLLVASLQEAVAKIESLEARVTALEV